jgi:hypothetical protein
MANTSKVSPPALPPEMSTSGDALYDSYEGVCTSAVPVSGGIVTMPQGVLTQEQASSLFRELARLTFVTETIDESNREQGNFGEIAAVPFGPLSDGCQNRAHLMEERLTLRGVDSRKIMALSAKDKLMHFGWNWHVAVLVQVVNDQNEIVDMVMDPSIATAPLTISEWTSLLDMEKGFKIIDEQAYVTGNTRNNVVVIANKYAYDNYSLRYYKDQLQVRQRAASNMFEMERFLLTRMAKTAEADILAVKIYESFETTDPLSDAELVRRARTMFKEAPADVQRSFKERHAKLYQSLKHGKVLMQIKPAILLD